MVFGPGDAHAGVGMVHVSANTKPAKEPKESKNVNEESMFERADTRELKHFCLLGGEMD